MLSRQTPRKGRFPFALPLCVIGAIAGLSGWLAPNHYPPWVSFHGEAAAFASLVFFCATVLVYKKSIVFDRVLLIFFALIGIVWLQQASGQVMYAGDAVVSSLYLAGLALAWWLGTNSASTQREEDVSLTLLASLLVVGATVSIFIALLQWLRMEALLGVFAADRGPGMRLFGNLGQPNHLATLALMGLVLSSLLYVQSRIKRWQWIVLVAYLSFGLILTESRAGLLSAFVLGSFFLFYSKRSWRMGSWKVIAAWWATLIVLAVLWVPLNEALYLRAARGEMLTQDQPRITMWKQMVAAIAESPWTGYGWRQTVVAQKAGANVVEGTLPTDYAHNLPLDLIIWLGIPLGSLVLLLICYWLVRAVTRIENPTQFFLLAGVIPVGVHSLLEFPFAYAYFLFPVGWLLGALSVQQGPNHPSAGDRRHRCAWFLAAGWLLAFAGLCCWVTVDYLKAEEDYRVMRFELRHVGRPPMNYAAPRLVLLTQFGEMLTVGRMVPYPGMPPQDIERMRIANASFAWATLQLSYAIALGLNGQPEEASRQLQNLRAVYGKESYLQALEVFLNVEKEKYPQLGLIKLP